MKLLKTKATREGYENYTDLYLGWVYEGKKYLVRVRPVFGVDNSKLLANSVEVPEGAKLQDYVE